jgi:nickel-dependent lactate racemase
MPMRTVAYGARPLNLPDALFNGEFRVQTVMPPPPPPEADVEDLLTRALTQPIQSRPLASLATASSRVTVVVADATRDDPRGLLVRSIRRELSHVPDSQITIAVANGTGHPGSPEALGLGDAIRKHPFVNHDASDYAAMVDLGQTGRGTRVRIHRCAAEADLVIATGRIRPHYFAGFDAGAKTVFPGLGARDDVRQNHRLVLEPSSRLGQVAGNACRQDLEEAVRLLRGRTFLLNVVMAQDRAAGAVAGDLIAAHRVGCELARPYCQVQAELADIVIVSDSLPVSVNLYQASKLLAPGGQLVRPGGVVILAAECPRGVGPLGLVDETVFRAGVRQFFPSEPEPHVYLVSSLPNVVVEQTHCLYAASLEDALEQARRLVRPTPGQPISVLVLPRAGDLIPAAA